MDFIHILYDVYVFIGPRGTMEDDIHYVPPARDKGVEKVFHLAGFPREWLGIQGINFDKTYVFNE